MGTCIVISAGGFAGEKIVPGPEDLVIAADAGFRKAKSILREGDLVVGDFDSLAEAGAKAVSELEKWEEAHPASVIRLPAEKDDTDTLAAVKIGLERGYHTFALYGMLGGDRQDHTLANLQTLLYLKNHHANGTIRGDGETWLILKDEGICLRSDKDCRLSVFSVSPESQGVMIRGCRYEMTHGRLTSDTPLGVSNEIPAGCECHVSVERGILLVGLKE